MTHAKKIVVVQGHPDSSGGHFCHALADTYIRGARAAGHSIATINVGALDFPLLRSPENFYRGQPPDAIRQAQAELSRCDHIVLLYPVWNSAMPALLKGFLEQTFRPGFIFPDLEPGKRLGFFSAIRQRKALTGKSARIVVTMQMPAFVFRWLFHPRPEKTTLGLSGIGPIRDSLIGLVDMPSPKHRRRWLRRMRECGRNAC